jgi:hypothetical protein
MGLSSRTQSYVDAMIREGENFDRAAWLKRVREQELLATDVPNRVDSDDSKIDNFELGKSDRTQSSGMMLKEPISKPICPTRPFPRINELRPLRHKQTLRQRISVVEHAWNEMKSKHKRSAIYGYLAAVFDLVSQYRRRKIRKLLRYVSRMIGLRPGYNVDPFAATIRCTCDGNIDRKTISRWSRALRYVAKHKPPDTGLKTFMQRTGGINACADRFAQIRRRRQR